MPIGIYEHRKPSEETKEKISLANKGKIRSKEFKEKVRLRNIGKKHSLETKRKMSLTHKGRKLSDESRLKISKSHLGKKRSEEDRVKQSITRKDKFSRGLIKVWNKGLTKEKDTRVKINGELSGKTRKGSKFTLERRIKLKGLRLGEQTPNWKGGITKLKHRIRELFEYNIWREAVFNRDDFTCIICKIRGGRLQVHHLKSFSSIIIENNIKSVEDALKCNILWDTNNGVTMCLSCHSRTDNFLKRKKEYGK